MVVLLGLVAIGVPSAMRAIVGRPRLLLVAVVASGIASTLAQAAGELARLPAGVVGDAQLGAAVLASVGASALVAMVEGARPAAVPKKPLHTRD